ncbi:hypothetical protein L1987_17767 [Smallanthus sonchifolius]|uniref:Uncharacterized protein n=1 Tax=Smallanthus sonchifolius TaxID=185202 RepID=A0ACB9IXX3_9ASTR|nr:hypothetical protein L1987_17767 [Smallanthus sonchifolius]
MKGCTARIDLTPSVVLRGHKRGIWSVEFSPVDQCVITASGDETIKIWAISDYKDYPWCSVCFLWVKGTRFFECPPLHGAMVRQDKVKLAATMNEFSSRHLSEQLVGMCSTFSACRNSSLTFNSTQKSFGIDDFRKIPNGVNGKSYSDGIKMKIFSRTAVETGPGGVNTLSHVAPPKSSSFFAKYGMDSGFSKKKYMSL